MDRSHAFPAQTEHSPGLGFGRHLQGHLAIQRGYLHRAAQSGGGEANGNFTVQIPTIPLENRVSLDPDIHIEVSGRPAVSSRLPFPIQADTIPGIHARRNLHGQCLYFPHTATPGAPRARRLYDVPGTAANGAGLLNGEKPLLCPNLPSSPAGFTRSRLSTRLGAGPAAPFALYLSGHLDIDGITADRLLQGKLQLIAQIGTAEYPAAAAGTAAKDIPENITKDVAERIGAGTEAAAGCLACLHAGVAELLVGRPLLGVGQNLVGFLGFLKFALGIGVVRIAVRVMLHGQATIRLLELSIPSGPIAPQDLVIVALGHHLSLNVTRGRVVTHPLPPSYYRDPWTVLRRSSARRRS